MGKQVQQHLNICKVGQLRAFSKEVLQKHFGQKSGSWLYLVCRGVDHEPIKSRLLSQSIGCGKNFIGLEKLTSVQQVLYWLEQLTEEIFERLKVDQDENSRMAELLVVHFHPEESPSALSRSCPLHHQHSPASVARSLWTAMMRGYSGPTSVDPAGRTPLTWTTGIVRLSVVATKFRPLLKSSTCNLDMYVTGPRESPGKAQSCVGLVEVGAKAVIKSEDENIEQQPPAKRLYSEIKIEPIGLGTVGRSQHDIRNYFGGSGCGSGDFDGGGCGNSNGVCSPDVCQRCAGCGQLIPIWRLQEHTDYHFALQLHQEESSPLKGGASLVDGMGPPRSQKDNKQPVGQKRERTNSLHKFLIMK